MSKWAEFYKDRATPGYLEYAKVRYRPFLDAIKRHVRPGDRVLEIGAGVGTITAALLGTTPGYMIATDNDHDQIATMRERFSGDGVPVHYLEARFVDSVRADVIHSHGLLEHFDDDTIRSIIEAGRGARAQVHYVPGLYPAPSFGDERLLPVSAWWDIANPTEIITFNGGLDYALVFA